MRILFCGDIVGKSGRDSVAAVVPTLREKLRLDAVIANGENAAHGFGLTPKLYQSFLRQGIDVVTLGNHSFDKADINPALESEPCLIRPMNYPENTIGKGFCIREIGDVRLCVVQLLGKVFMRPVDDPFERMDAFLKTHEQGRDYDVLVVDFHAEATAEKVGMGHFLDGRASLVVGTHTHIPTADVRILPGGTGYQTDVGMCGDYQSVIGMTVASAMPRFVPGGQPGRLNPAEEAGTFCGVVADIDAKSGRCVEIFPVRIGAHLENTHEI